MRRSAPAWLAAAIAATGCVDYMVERLNQRAMAQVAAEFVGEPAPPPLTALPNPWGEGVVVTPGLEILGDAPVDVGSVGALDSVSREEILNYVQTGTGRTKRPEA